MWGSWSCINDTVKLSVVMKNRSDSVKTPDKLTARAGFVWTTESLTCSGISDEQHRHTQTAFLPVTGEPAWLCVPHGAAVVWHCHFSLNTFTQCCWNNGWSPKTNTGLHLRVDFSAVAIQHAGCRNIYRENMSTPQLDSIREDKCVLLQLVFSLKTSCMFDCSKDQMMDLVLLCRWSF